MLTRCLLRVSGRKRSQRRCPSSKWSDLGFRHEEVQAAKRTRTPRSNRRREVGFILRQLMSVAMTPGRSPARCSRCLECAALCPLSDNAVARRTSALDVTCELLFTSRRCVRVCPGRDLTGDPPPPPPSGVAFHLHDENGKYDAPRKCRYRTDMQNDL